MLQLQHVPLAIAGPLRMAGLVIQKRTYDDTASNRGFRAASNRGFGAASNRGLGAASNRGFRAASNRGIRAASKQATGVSGQGTCMMPWGPKHSWKRMRPTLGSTALSGSSSSMMSAREYAALASASLAFCPPTHHITPIKVSQVVLHPKHEPFVPSHAHSTLRYGATDKCTRAKWAKYSRGLTLVHEQYCLV